MSAKTPRHPGSPCITCKRVMSPELCTSMGCLEWREWFTITWEQARSWAGLNKSNRKDGVHDERILF